MSIHKNNSKNSQKYLKSKSNLKKHKENQDLREKQMPLRNKSKQKSINNLENLESEPILSHLMSLSLLINWRLGITTNLSLARYKLNSKMNMTLCINNSYFCFPPPFLLKILSLNVVENKEYKNQIFLKG